MSLAPTASLARSLRLRMRDGAALPACLWSPNGEPRAVSLLLHAFGDYRRAFAHLGPWLARRGVLALSYDQRGFGETHGFGRWAGEAQYICDALDAAAWLRGLSPSAPLLAMGESMGGSVAIAAAAEQASFADGLILANPAVRKHHPYRAPLDLAIYGLDLLAPAAAITLKRESLACGRPARRRLAKDPRVLRRIRADTYAGCVRLADHATLAATRVRAPALVLFGRRDWLIHRRSVEALTRDLAGPVRLVTFADLPHLILQCDARHRVLRVVDGWIDRATVRNGLKNSALLR